MSVLINMIVDILHQEINEADKIGKGKPIAWCRVRDSEEERYGDST